MTALSSALGYAEPSTLLILSLTALLGGMVRGFTGFGFAMVFVPIASVVVGPVTAVALIWFIDLPFVFPLAAMAFRQTEWREVIPLFIGATLLFPVGVWMLTSIDPVTARWVIALLILSAVATLSTGWRYKGAPGKPLSIGVGGISGITSGLASLGGMPIAVFWLAAQKSNPRQAKINMNAYLGTMTFVSGAVLWWNGILTWATVQAAAVLCVPFGFGLLAGFRMFDLASEQTFRRVAYMVITFAALAALPILDGVIGRR
ncbi:MAG: TSUP family transporter [Beijerinckiaceae bacterium]